MPWNNNSDETMIIVTQNCIYLHITYFILTMLLPVHARNICQRQPPCYTVDVVDAVEIVL